MIISTKIKSISLSVMLFSMNMIAVKGQSVLDSYVEEGLQNNIVLKQRNIALNQAEYAVKIAKSYFFPSVAFSGNYTTSEGGRRIAIPLGDILNPVYSTLNQLTNSSNFPQLSNVEETFLPKNFYDTKLRTSMPILNTELNINREIQQQQVQLKDFEVDIYKRDLVFNIKSAYFNYLSAMQGVKIYESALELVNRNVSVNQSLLKNGKNLPANLLRAQSETDQVNAQLGDARNNVKKAQNYFNFLLNKDLNEEIKSETLPETIEVADTAFIHAGIQNREELKALKTAAEIQENLVKMNKQFWVPKVNAFVDVGSQASNWKFNDQSRYYLAGVQLDFPIFNGQRNTLKLKQSKLAAQDVQLQLENTAKQLQLSTDISRNDLNTAYQNYQASRNQLKSAQSYFNLIQKGYNEGVNSMIEFIDGRNQLTTSQLQANIRLLDVQNALAKLERETAAYSNQTIK